MTQPVIVHYYDSTSSRIVRSREYASLRLARAAMARAAKRHQIAGIAVKSRGGRNCWTRPTWPRKTPI